MRLGSLLTLPSLALQTTAKALRVLAFANEMLAERLASSPPSPDSPVDSTPPRRPVPAPPSAAPVTPAPAPAPGVTAAPRDPATLAALAAPAVIDVLDDLSTAELADLFDHESAHRRRRTVLRAIEAALAPPPSAVTDDDLDDVRVPDELVYSTVTPGR